MLLHHEHAHHHPAAKPEGWEEPVSSVPDSDMHVILSPDFQEHTVCDKGTAIHPSDLCLPPLQLLLLDRQQHTHLGVAMPQR